MEIYGLHNPQVFPASSAPFSTSPAPSKAWHVGKLNHVAIAVPDLEKASALYRDVLGAEVSDVVVSAVVESTYCLYTCCIHH